MNPAGLLARLPAPPAGRAGWPWTEETDPGPATGAPAGGWPAITIVCPSFNQGRYLEETLRSVLLQNYPALEFLVLDGGSTDGSVGLLQRYAPWLAHWESQPDRGQAHAINKGCTRATGEIVGWINSDDYYLPGALFAVGRAFRAAPRSLLYGDWGERLDEAPEITLHRERPAFAFQVAVGGRHLPSHATFWPRAAHQPVDENLRFTMDAELFKRLAASGLRPRHVPQPLGVFRRHAAAKTATILAVARAESEAWSRTQPWHTHWRWRFSRWLDQWRSGLDPDGIAPAANLRQRARNLAFLIRRLGAPAVPGYLRSRAAERAGRATRPHRLRTRRALHPLLCRPNTSDFPAFNLTFASRDYDCLDELTDVRRIIDCGANVGYTSANFLSRFPSAHVIAVEPDPDNFALLSANLAPYGPRASLRRAAVWSTPGTLVLVTAGYRDGLPWSRQVRAARPGETADIPAVDLPTLLREAGGRVDLLKIDIEGAEAELFAADCRPWLDGVRAIIIELHDDRCQEVFFRSIAGAGFHCTRHGEHTFCRRPWPPNRS